MMSRPVPKLNSRIKKQTYTTMLHPLLKLIGHFNNNNLNNFALESKGDRDIRPNRTTEYKKHMT